MLTDYHILRECEREDVRRARELAAVGARRERRKRKRSARRQRFFIHLLLLKMQEAKAL